MAVKWFGDSVFGNVQKAAMRGVVLGTESLRETMIQYIMNPPKTGKIYHRNGRRHQASAPGEKPANDTGNLVKSITTKYDPVAVSGTVNVGAEYGLRLEYGFVGQDSLGRMYDQAARPFARPAVVERSPDIRAGIAKEIEKELKK